jgi:HEAT repeat protein
LGGFKTEGVMELLVQSLKDSDSSVRWAAVVALEGRKTDSIVEPLIQTLLKDENAGVRWKAAVLLRELKSDKVVDPFIQALLHDTNEGVRWEAVSALEALKPEKGVSPLIQALNDKNEGIRGKAAMVLGELCKGVVSKRLHCEETVSSLVEVLKDKNSWVRSNVVAALGALKSKKAIEPLQSLLKDKDASVQEKAAFALTQIDPGIGIRLLDHRVSSLARAASDALVEVCESGTLEVLKKLELEQKNNRKVYIVDLSHLIERIEQRLKMEKIQNDNRKQ